MRAAEASKVISQFNQVGEECQCGEDGVHGVSVDYISSMASMAAQRKGVCATLVRVAHMASAASYQSMSFR